MQFLHALLGPPADTTGTSLLSIALKCCVNRVVVKRPRGAPPLGGTEHWRGQLTRIESANTRYDVYHRL
jgi:16S rRNA (guanine1516-N2)-methyltransferase